VDVRALTEDGFLDGRVRVRQPRSGFRSGLDAVMLAAAVPARDGDKLLELGAGAGVASLCVAARVAGCSIAGVELDGALVALANANASANGLDARVRFVEADALKLPRALRTGFDHVFCNPPFHGGGEASPDAGRSRALHDQEGDLPRWLAAGVQRTAANGTFTIILRADRLDDALDALPRTGVKVFPLWPRAGEAAKRVIVQVRIGSRRPLTLLPGMVLHQKAGGYTPEADAVLRGRAALPLGD
jgi:tRNA1Val (adenine37-N6)-methyltransferase